jgi:hypothetical protein
MATPRWNHDGADEIEGHSLHAVLEEAPPPPEHDRVDPELVLVDEVVFQQTVREVVGAVHDQVLTRLLLELGHGVRDIALDQMGVLPPRVLEGG